MMNKLIDAINVRAQAAGFKLLDDSQAILVNDDNWPEDQLENRLSYWFSEFASILLVEIDCDTYVEAWNLSKRAETYLDAALVQREKDGSFVDGYLVLAITQMNDDLKPFIEEVERDTRFVRKHVVYEGAYGWERYERITPLGLVSSVDKVQGTEFIPDTEESSRLLESLARLGSRELAKAHGKEWDLNE